MNCEVDIAPLREAFQRSDLSAADVCRRLGWLRQPSQSPRSKHKCPYADETRLMRTLGIWRDKGRRYRSTTYENALAIAEAVGVDPVDVGL